MADDLTLIFALLGSTGVKAARKTLMKSIPDLAIDVHPHHGGAG
jgi:hypothetical protein